MTESDLLWLCEARELAASGAGRDLRVQSRLTMGEVARALGVAVSTVSRWESGLKTPTGSAGVSWAKLLRGLRSSKRGRSKARKQAA